MLRRVEGIRLAGLRQPEVQRIVGGLRSPDQPRERLLEVLRRREGDFPGGTASGPGAEPGRRGVGRVDHPADARLT